MKNSRVISSYKDPSGFIFSQNGLVYRQINKNYRADFDLLINSGLYESLVKSHYLVPHEEISLSKFETSGEAYKIIKPQVIPFISYPNEWCFSMLKDAALLTLSIQKKAISCGMSLKDSSIYNVQFLNGKATLIDTLSFEKYQEGKPWIAYKQFIEHFLGPLALMAYSDIRLNSLFISYTDGVPVGLISHLLPIRAKFNPMLLLHIFAHSASQRKNADKKLNKKQIQQSFGRSAMMGLIDSLEFAVRKFKLSHKETEWGDYYESNNNYRSTSQAHKEKLVREFVGLAKPKMTWDLGANTGRFSRIAASGNSKVISFDIDHGALEQNYKEVLMNKDKNILPLFSDLTNPTPAIGWANQERLSLLDRGPSDLIMALALVHHLAIGKNIPMDYIAELFANQCQFCMVEFIPKEDSQVKKLLMNREDIFPEYSKSGFEKTFKKYFKIKKSTDIKGSKRVLYLMEKLHE